MSVAVEELLRVEGLRVSLGDVAILHGIDLQLFGGEVLGLVGPNGSGKTTLLRAVSRLVPSSGRVWLAGADVRTLDERGVALRAARVPQATILDATMALTVEDVVMAGRSPHLGRFQWETAHDRALAREAMQSTATDVLAERLAAELSGGERQRAFLARALAQQPRVLLLDEPTANLDIGHQVRVLGLVRKLAGSSGLAALAAIHDLELAARFCDRLVLLQEGRVVIQGTPGEVIRAEWLREVYGVSAIVESNPHVRGLRVTVMEVEQ